MSARRKPAKKRRTKLERVTFGCREPGQERWTAIETFADSHAEREAAALFADHCDFMELEYPAERTVHVQDAQKRETTWRCTPDPELSEPGRRFYKAERVSP